MTSFIVPSQNSEYEFSEKHSRFIGRIFKIESSNEASEILKGLRKKYWDATHHVYAYILSDGTEKFSDDGEPQGTSGMPTLTVLRGFKVKNALCVTTRYFGGTLLGTGGLVRAYSQAAKGAVEKAGLSVMTPFCQLSLTCDYTFLEPLRRLFPKIGIIETGCEYGEKAVLSLMCEPERLEKAKTEITELSSGALSFVFSGDKLFEKKLEP